MGFPRADSLQVVRAPRVVAARRAAFTGVNIRSHGVARAAAARPTAAAIGHTRRASPVAALQNDHDTHSQSMPAGFNMALAAMVTGSVFSAGAISPEWAEAARGGGRMGRVATTVPAVTFRFSSLSKQRQR